MEMLSCKGDEEESIMSACFPIQGWQTGSWTAEVSCEMVCWRRLWMTIIPRATLHAWRPRSELGGAILIHAVYQIHVVRTAMLICYCYKNFFFSKPQTRAQCHRALCPLILQPCAMEKLPAPKALMAADPMMDPVRLIYSVGF